MPRPAALVAACAAVAACLLPPSAAQGPADEVSRRLSRWEAEPALRPFATLTPPGVGLTAPTGQRMSLHIGVNRLDPAKYPGVPSLEAAEADALALHDTARLALFEAKLLVGERATTRAVLAEFAAAAARLRAGDLFLVTFAGHGALVKDFNNNHAPRGYDQAFCLYDRMLVDDEIVTRWADFKPGVKVLILLDSCHSGTSKTARARGQTAARSAKALAPGKDAVAKLVARSVGGSATPRVRALPTDEHAQANAVQESELIAATKGLDSVAAVARTQAAVLRIAACRADQESLEVGRHGLFTHSLLELWDGGRFPGTYRDLVARAGALTSPYQEPTLDYYGEEVVSFLANPSFR
ncbi:MAG TPA: caspase family protein [Urbifossiella sp.]|nr:caspase family protein [Urbifossiella sp.]